MNMTDIITNVTLNKACSIKADADSTDSKTINLRIKFDGATLGDVFAKAVSSAVISWQNGVGRKGYDTFKANQTVEVQFTSPASKPQIDPETAMIAKLQSMTPDEQMKYLRELTAKASK